MAQKSQRNRRRGPAKDASRPDSRPDSAGGSQDRYQKYLPEWMKGPNGAAAARPRVRRARPTRAVGGYTPGKRSAGDPLS